MLDSKKSCQKCEKNILNKSYREKADKIGLTNRQDSEKSPPDIVSGRREECFEKLSNIIIRGVLQVSRKIN